MRTSAYDVAVSGGGPGGLVALVQKRAPGGAPGFGGSADRMNLREVFDE